MPCLCLCLTLGVRNCLVLGHGLKKGALADYSELGAPETNEFENGAGFNQKRTEKIPESLGWPTITACLPAYKLKPKHKV